MTFLSEDPTYLTAAFLILAVGCVAALRVTQQGKYLLFACASCGFAVAVLMVEHFWVTDNERIERVVYHLGDAVRQSDSEAILSQLAPNVQYSKEDSTLSPDATREMIRSNIGRFHFDLLRVGSLKTNVGEQSRRGTAEFQVVARATQHRTSATLDSGTALTAWSLGFQETAPGVWKVSRISPVSIPSDVLAFAGGISRSDPMRITRFQHEALPNRAIGRGSQISRGRRGTRYPVEPGAPPPTDIH